MRKNWSLRACLLGAGAAIVLGLSGTALGVEASPLSEVDRLDLVRASLPLAHDVDAAAVVNLELKARPGEAVVVTLPIDGVPVELDLEPFSVRSPHYTLLVQVESGELVEHPAGPERTLRGTVSGWEGAVVAASLNDDGLSAMIRREDGDVWWVQPVNARIPNVRPGDHFLYQSSDVLPGDWSCGVEHDFAARPDEAVIDGPMQGGIAGTPCVAELGCETDFEYFQDYGSVGATEARINSVINTVNVQYETQVGITHQITTIIVRSTSNDPYTQTSSEGRLCQFITEWTNNQQGIQRDVAHMFTGVDLNGSTIGRAADIGATGICVSQGSCTGGQFGTQGSYCISQSDFNGNFSCATDLTAHELGHLWGAFHCSCPSNTMNSGITCANSFTGATINSITAYANTRTCLTGPCGGGGIDNDNCADAEPFNGGNGDAVIAYSTVGANTDGPENPADQCNDFGQNQTWSDIWYTYTATCSGTLTVTTCDDIHGQGDPDYDTDLVLYGPYPNLGAINCSDASLLANLAVCNDDDDVNGCGTSAPFSSTINFDVVQGEVYLIRVGGWSSGDAGNGFLSVMCSGVSSNGACCFTSGACIETDPTDCANIGGDYQGDGITCAQANCPQPTGACCFGDGSCIEVIEFDCIQSGGAFQGVGVTCGQANCPQPTGACCFDDGSCSELESDECNGLGGAYQGDGVTCAQANCPLPTGACCFDDGSCLVLEADECTGFGGVYQGDDVTCAQANCPLPTGACCFADGSCLSLTAGDCSAQGGDYQGDGITCAQANCPLPTGACCFPDGTCAEIDAGGCATLGGDYQGDDVACTQANCPPPTGACCFSDGTCAEIDAPSCSVQGGDYQGDGIPCSQADCALPCPADCADMDGTVGIADLLALLAAWGQKGGPCDLNGSGIDVTDVLELLAAWGDCP